MNRVLISLEDDLVVPFNIEEVELFANKVLGELKLDLWEVSVLFCSDKTIQELNKNYRDIDDPTDVLSFEQGDTFFDEDDKEWYAAGDIVISYSALQRNAENFSVSENDELKRLIVHGILHLNGMDHSHTIDEVNKDKSIEEPMLIQQEEILKKFEDIKIYKDME